MGIGASLFLIALGAVLKWGVTTHLNGVDLSNIGTILMVVGVIGLVLTAILLMTRRRTDIVHESDRVVADPAVPTTAGRRVSRTTYVEPNRIDTDY